MRYFKLTEFDSPDAPGSGAKMDKEFLAMIDEARHLAGVPFKINSGYRTQAHHEALGKRGYKTAKNSAHLTGHAADIHAPNTILRFAIVAACIRAGVSSCDMTLATKDDVMCSTVPIVRPSIAFAIVS